MTIDEAKAAFDSLVQKWSTVLPTIDNEANTRFVLIDEILSNVLGWNRLGEFQLERYTEAGFADYLLAADAKDRMVVEAKRATSVLVGTRAKSTQYLVAKSSALDNARAGLDQAQRYCVSTGTVFAVLTSGVEWIAYWAVREHGMRPSEGKVIVFPSVDAIAQDFAQFWDLFSREGVLEERFKVRIREVEGLRVQAKETLKPVVRATDIRFLAKSQLAIDLDRVFKEFFSSMAGQNDSDMLAQCFVESKESREADVNLEKIATTLLNRLQIMSSEEGEQLQIRMQGAIESRRGEFVLIIGNKGAGKTTFIDRFFRLVLPSSLRENCALIRVDVGDSTGDIQTIASWLDRQVLTALEADLFEKGIAKNEQLQGIFYSEYCRWKEGPHKTLYNTDKDAFKIKFGEYLENIRSNDPHGYIETLLKDVVDNRHKMPCLVFDNTDHFNEAFQEAVFQYAQSIFRNSFSFVICPITDRTIWELSKHGPLQSYDTTSFYLPVPAMKHVLEKRISFIRSKLNEKDQKARAEYFIGRGIRLSVQDLTAFAAYIEEIFVKNEGVSRIIGGLSNFDIRRSLKLSQKVVTSPHIKIDELVRLYLTEGRAPVKQRSISLGIMCGDSNRYRQDASNFVMNIFEVQGEDLTSPLLALRLLRFFSDIDSQAGEDVQNAHASVEDAQGYFSSMGVAPSSVKNLLQKLSSAQLLAPFDAAEDRLTEESHLRITPSGKIHQEWALGNSVYVTEMAVSTPMRSGRHRDELVALSSRTAKRTREDWDRLVAIFAEYCQEQDQMFITTPTMAAYTWQTSIRDQFCRRWALPEQN